jgi:putative FmdB family regulatory protein
MPTYEYKCDACGHAFEKFQSIKAAPIRKCPNCGKMKVRKLISKGAGLIFKGSGFYITDYRSEGYKDQAKAEGGGAKSESKETGGGGGAEGKSQSKSDAKPAAESAPAKTESKAEPKPAATASSKSDSKPASSSQSGKK